MFKAFILALAIVSAAYAFGTRAASDLQSVQSARLAQIEAAAR